MPTRLATIPMMARTAQRRRMGGRSPKSRYDNNVIYTNCECPVDPGDGIPYVIALSGKSPVLLYCPSCECAWANAKEVEGNPTRGLREFGLSEAVIRFATESEIRAAGHDITGTYAPWCELPRPPNHP